MEQKYDELQKANESLQNQIRQLKASIEATGEEVLMEDPRIGELEEELQRRKAEMEAMQKHVSELEQEKKQQEKELQKAREQISTLEAESKQPTIVTDDTQMKEALEKSLQVEKELRAANRALEK